MAVTKNEIESVLSMLSACKEMSVKACSYYANMSNHPAFKSEGLPELLRAQEQNATALITQAEKIWKFILHEFDPRAVNNP